MHVHAIAVAVSAAAAAACGAGARRGRARRGPPARHRQARPPAGLRRRRPRGHRGAPSGGPGTGPLERAQPRRRPRDGRRPARRALGPPGRGHRGDRDASRRAQRAIVPPARRPASRSPTPSPTSCRRRGRPRPARPRDGADRPDHDARQLALHAGAPLRAMSTNGSTSGRRVAEAASSTTSPAWPPAAVAHVVHAHLTSSGSDRWSSSPSTASPASRGRRATTPRTSCSPRSPASRPVTARPGGSAASARRLARRGPRRGARRRGPIAEEVAQSLAEDGAPAISLAFGSPQPRRWPGLPALLEVGGARSSSAREVARCRRPGGCTSPRRASAAPARAPARRRASGSRRCRTRR